MKNLFFLLLLISSFVFGQKYDTQTTFNQQGYSIVSKDGKYGVVDTSGTEVLPLEYAELAFSPDGKGVIIQKGEFKDIFLTFETGIANFPPVAAPHSDPEIDDLSKVYEKAEKEAVFTGKGGIGNFLADNLKYPQQAVDSGTEGRIVVKFIVEKDGTVSDIQTLGRKLGNGLEEEAIKVISKTSGQWTPAEKDDKPLRSYIQVPIRFRLEPKVVPSTDAKTENPISGK